jgi:hypothetical protein
MRLLPSAQSRVGFLPAIRFLDPPADMLGRGAAWGKMRRLEGDEEYRDA